MSAYAWALRPDATIPDRGRRANGALHAALGVLRALGELVAYSYRLRTAAGGVRATRSAAR